LSRNFRIIVFVVVLFQSICYSGKTQVLDSVDAVVDRFSHYLLYRDQDTNYIANFGNEFALKLVTMNKYNYFALFDTRKSNSIIYQPARDLYLGIGFAYKWLALDLTLGVGLSGTKEFDEQQSFDFQGRVYSSKHYFAGTLQYYRGYKLNRSYQFDPAAPVILDSGETGLRKDIRTNNIELQYLYALNYTRFSLKAPFVLNEVQKKSAGSFIAGGAFSSFTMNGDSSIIPVRAEGLFNTEAQLNNLNILSLGINFGYMHTFVIGKNFFVTASLIPGIHYYSGDYSSPNIKSLNSSVNLKLISMNAFGYNGRRIFAGFNISYNGFLAKIIDGLYPQIGHGKLSLFVGYRFKSKKDRNG